jgi:hypothetical protein
MEDEAEEEEVTEVAYAICYTGGGGEEKKETNAHVLHHEPLSQRPMHHRITHSITQYR